MRIKKEIIRKIFLLFVSITPSFYLVEFIIRIFSPMSPYHTLLPLFPNIKMKLNVKLKGCLPIIAHSTNKLGLRGDAPPCEWERYYTIVTIGGSTTQCFYLDDHKTWPYLLQEKLKREIFQCLGRECRIRRSDNKSSYYYDERNYS